MLILSALILPLSLTGCNISFGKQPINTISDIYIPQDKFECADKPDKPPKYMNPKSGKFEYTVPDTGKLLNDTEFARADCKDQLHEVRDIYNEQKAKRGLDRAKGDGK